MSKKKEKPICLSKLEPEEKLKYEIAEELGLLEGAFFKRDWENRRTDYEEKARDGESKRVVTKV